MICRLLLLPMMVGLLVGSIVRADAPPAAKIDAKQAMDLYYQALEFQTGTGSKPLDLARGKELLLKAAEAGNTLAMNRLGDMYAMPDGGVAIDLAQARTWFDRSAAMDDPYGCLWSANLPDHTLTPEDEKKRYAKAFHAAQEAVRKGDATGMFVMSVFLMTGRGVARNDEMAVQSLQSASNDGYLPATRELAASYAHGDGTAKDPAKAFALYTSAAKSNMSVHLMDLGLCYDTGTGVERDYTKAMEYYVQAAERGSARSMTNVAQMIAQGQGAPKDPVKATQYLQKAADLGWPPAMFYLGKAYELGQGVTADPVKAMEWIKKAAAAGNAKAKKYLTDNGVTQ